MTEIKNEISVTGVFRIQIGNKSIDLSQEEARELHEALSSFLGLTMYYVQSQYIPDNDGVIRYTGKWMCGESFDGSFT